MSRRPRQAELALQQACAAAGVDDPSCRDGARRVAGRQRHFVIRLAKLDRAHGALVEHLGSRRSGELQQHVLESAAVELEGRHGRVLGRAQLDAPLEIAIVRMRKKISQAELLELRAAQVRFEIQHLLKIMRADLDRRFTNLECGLPDRMLALFGHEHANRWRFQVQLPREAEPGEPPPE